MNNISQTIESSLKSITKTLSSTRSECQSLVKYYYATAQAAIQSNADSDPVTVSTGLTKAKLVAGITMAEQINNFFGNAAVTQGDYLVTCDNLLNGSVAPPQVISQDVEAVGTRLRTLANNLLQLYQNCLDVVASYNSSELSSAVGVISVHTIVFGCSLTKQLLTDTMNLVQQFSAFMNNGVVVTGDYQSSTFKLLNA